MSGYRFDLWLEWVDAHAVRRDDGRITHLGRAVLPESHRNTITNWIAQMTEPIPLGRWDEILIAAGFSLIPDFEQWLEREHGSNGYLEGKAGEFC